MVATLIDTKELTAKREQEAQNHSEIATKMLDATHSDTPIKDKDWKILVQQEETSSRAIQAMDALLSVIPTVAPVHAKSYEESALARWIRRGVDGLAVEERQAHLIENATSRMGGMGFSIKSAGGSESTAGATDPAGGDIPLVSPSSTPTGVFDVTTTTNVMHNLKAFGGVRRIAAGITTSRGENLILPTLSNTDQEGELLPEATYVEHEAIPQYGQIVMGANTFSTRVVVVSNQYIVDSAIDVVADINIELGRRLGRIYNRLLTEGTGTHEISTQPQGVVTGAGVEVTSSKATNLPAIAYEDLIKMEHSIDSAYREGAETPDPRDRGRSSSISGYVGFIFSDSVLRLLKFLKDGDGRPLWIPSITVGEPGSILGYPYVINHHMDAFPTTLEEKTVALFGHFDYYLIRDIDDLTLFRLADSKYIERNSVGFLGLSRMDAKVRGALNSSNKCEAITKLITPST